jgi:Beta-ketoacyl synthase, N-terminal domain
MSAGSLRVGVEAVALCGPGLPDWDTSQRVLAGAEPYRTAPVVLVPPPQLSPAERRRAVPSVKLALQVGTAAVKQSGLDPTTLPAVFASSGADGETIHSILATLTTPTREVSPTRFHNSVHNAPSGYWGLAVQSQEVVSSIGCHDASFTAGLLEAAVQAVAGDRPILLIAYDLPYPSPLESIRPIGGSFGVAMVLSPSPSHRSLAELLIRSADTSGDPTGCADQGLEALRRGNPAARSLPLLVALARQSGASIRLDLGHGALDVQVAPC